jgi:uncharacterized membrane protein
MSKYALFLVFTLVFLTGCVADNNTRQTSNNHNEMPPPIINVSTPPAQIVDTKGLEEAIRSEVVASSNLTQNQLSGLVNASISKVSEKIVGLEASISNNMTSTVMARLQASLEASITANANFQAEVRTSLDISNRLDLAVTAINTMSLKVGSLESQMAGAASAQVGFRNTFEQRMESVKNDMQAGRDINYLPKEAVEIVLSNNRTWMSVIGGILGLAQIICLYAYRNAKLREQNTNKLLMEALSRLSPEQAESIHKKL